MVVPRQQQAVWVSGVIDDRSIMMVRCINLQRTQVEDIEDSDHTVHDRQAFATERLYPGSWSQWGGRC